MSEPFLSEIKVVSFNFPPKGWALCNGQLLPINQNQALFSLLGTRYGGNGQTNFALPDLRGRVPIHFSFAHGQGERAGQEFHTITASEMPTHVHAAVATTGSGNTTMPGNALLGPANNLYGPPANLTTLHPQTVTNTGGGQPHENRQPYPALNVVIA